MNHDGTKHLLPEYTFRVWKNIKNKQMYAVCTNNGTNFQHRKITTSRYLQWERADRTNNIETKITKLLSTQRITMDIWHSKRIKCDLYLFRFYAHFRHSVCSFFTHKHVHMCLPIFEMVRTIGYIVCIVFGFWISIVFLE